MSSSSVVDLGEGHSIVVSYEDLHPHDPWPSSPKKTEKGHRTPDFVRKQELNRVGNEENQESEGKEAQHRH